MIDVTGSSETTVGEAIQESNEAQPIADTQERDCMRCEQTFTTTNAENADYCPKCATQPNAPIEPAKPRKWKTEAGPIQSKKVQTALSALSSEGRTYTEVSGVIGGEEHRMSFTQIWGGQREDSIKASDAVAAKFDWTVTRENYQAIIAECQEQLRVLVANRPVKDTRRTAEADAELTRKIAEREAARLAQAEASRQAEANRLEELRASAPATSAAGTVVRYNKEHDGVEIKFPSKPDKSVIDSCKRDGFRWGMRNKVWYKKFSPEAWKTACRIAGVDELPAPASANTDPAGAYVKAQEEAFADYECARIGA